MATTVALKLNRSRSAATPKTSVAARFLDTLATIRTRVQVTSASRQALALEDGLAQALSLIDTCARAGGKLMFIGNGGSAAIASHQAVDYWKNGGVKAVAFNDPSFLTCLSNDYGYERVFSEPINAFAQPGDVVIAISSSGRSPNILRAVEAARARACQVMTLSGFDDSNPLRALGELNFYVPSHGYGIVEVTHLMLLHAVLDDLCSRRQSAASGS